MGNSYLTFSPFFSNSDYNTWTYTYTKAAKPFKVNNQIIDNTVTVVSFDSITNQPFYDKGYSTYAKGYEVYAKDIGKVYQDLLNWEYQADIRIFNCRWVRCVNSKCDTMAIDCNINNCDSIKRIAGNRITCDTSLNSFYYEGYGTKLTMIDHN